MPNLLIKEKKKREMNPLQEKKLKEFREKFLEVTAYKGGSFACEKLEVWLTTTLEEVYKAGDEKGYKKGYQHGEDLLTSRKGNQMAFQQGFKEGEKNGLSRSVEAVKELKKSPDCGQNPHYPADQCTPTCGYNHAIEKAIRTIESLN